MGSRCPSPLLSVGGTITPCCDWLASLRKGRSLSPRDPVVNCSSLRVGAPNTGNGPVTPTVGIAPVPSMDALPVS
jgi:hypothetical protein